MSSTQCSLETKQSRCCLGCAVKSQHTEYFVIISNKLVIIVVITLWKSLHIFIVSVFVLLLLWHIVTLP